MDIVTQAVTGAVLAQSIAKPDEKKLAVLCGGLAGLLADADILIRSEADPLLTLEYHRHFTHALLFIPFGAALASIVLWPFLRTRLSPQRLYLFCLLGYCMSGLLDACTSYGTYLFWPFYDHRVAWNIISIVDPIFTLILIVALLLGLRYRTRALAQWGIVIGISYLGLGLVQQQRAEQHAHTLALARGHDGAEPLVKPTLGNLILWRSVYRYEQRFYVDAIRIGLLGQAVIFPGDSLAQFDVRAHWPDLQAESTLYRDIQRFTRFSDDYVALDPQQPNVLGDIRYSLLPQSTRPLWGIVLYPEQPQRHADYRFFREVTPSVRQTFINMLLGRCAHAQC